MSQNPEPSENDHSERRETVKPIRVDARLAAQLESRGCSSEDWDTVFISPAANIGAIRNVHFGRNVIIEEEAVVHDIPGGISGCHVERGARVENVASIKFEEDAPCGVGTQIAVLDETGSRTVIAYPGLSSQIATLMARVPSWVETKLSPSIQDFIDSRATPHSIGEGAVVRNCGTILNVSIGREVSVEGARNLINGSIINNAAHGRGLAAVGSGVDAENFIIEDGIVESGCIVRNCYVGQGALLEKGFTAHDSLFFANSTFENGEACAVIAGPYTVSMHKASLLIGIQTSFMNAGSATNMSNHMYKLGPVHWGVLERGAKTSSGSYLMLGARIGAFSLIMGAHKTHPDSSEFPFSYLFGDERGATVVVPGVMLRSCGLLRDEKKWPARDRRQKRRLPLHDRIHFHVLNPYTVDAMLTAIETITGLLQKPADDDLYIRYKGMKFSRAALDRARLLYEAAVFKFLKESLPDGKFPEALEGNAGEWVDVGGQLVKREIVDAALATETIDEAERLFNEAFERYKEDESLWIARRFNEHWRACEVVIEDGARRFDELVEEDRTQYLESLSRENKMLSL